MMIRHSSNTSVKRRPDRPRIIKIGLRSRPRKDYHMSMITKTEEAGMFAEVSVKKAISGSTIDVYSYSNKIKIHSKE